jgi:hypothetical protein
MSSPPCNCVRVEGGGPVSGYVTVQGDQFQKLSHCGAKTLRLKLVYFVLWWSSLILMTSLSVY